MPFQSTVYSTQAVGKPGTIARQNPLTRIPMIAEGTAVFAGGFVFEGTNPELQIIGPSADTASKTTADIAGVCVFEKCQMALRGGDNGDGLATLNVNPGEECATVKRGYVYVLSATASVHGQSVYVNTTTGEIQTGTSAPENFIDTGWKVQTGNAAGQTCEIYNI